MPTSPVVRVNTVAFNGIAVQPVDVQVQLAGGLPAFNLVGLPDKAVGESRDRVRAALGAMGLALPARRITINLAPADMAKEGSHFDLPIALALLAALEVVPEDALAGYSALGELSLDGRINRVAGVLPAAIDAADRGLGLICPEACGPEAAWAADEDGRIDVLAPGSLLALVNHVKGAQALAQPEPAMQSLAAGVGDLAEVKGPSTSDAPDR